MVLLPRYGWYGKLADIIIEKGDDLD